MTGPLRPPTDDSYDPGGASEEPCATLRTGPIGRLHADLYVCGPPAGHAATLAIFRAARFTRPPPRSTAAP